MTPLNNMLEKIRAAICGCRAKERDVLEALLEEAEVWEMRLQELDNQERKEE